MIMSSSLVSMFTIHNILDSSISFHTKWIWKLRLCFRFRTSMDFFHPCVSFKYLYLILLELMTYTLITELFEPFQRVHTEKKKQQQQQTISVMIWMKWSLNKTQHTNNSHTEMNGNSNLPSYSIDLQPSIHPSIQHSRCTQENSYIWKISLLVHPVQISIGGIELLSSFPILTNEFTYIYTGCGFGVFRFRIGSVSFCPGFCSISNAMLGQTEQKTPSSCKNWSIRAANRSAIETTIYNFPKNADVELVTHTHLSYDNFCTLYKYTNKF